MIASSQSSLPLRKRLAEGRQLIAATGRRLREPIESDRVRHRSRGRSGVHAELSEDPGYVMLGGLLADEQRTGDLTVCEAVGEEAKHLGLPECEAEVMPRGVSVGDGP